MIDVEGGLETGGLFAFGGVRGADGPLLELSLFHDPHATPASRHFSAGLRSLAL
jgi:hypothetical protein